MDDIEDAEDVKDSDDLHKWAIKCIRASRSHFADDREEKKIDYDFYAGKQWTDEEKLALEDAGRPAVVFNRCARTVNAIVGLETQNRQEVRYFPRELRDTQPIEMMSEAAKWVRDSCDAQDEESEAFSDNVICGEGWTETLLDYEIDDEGMILIERRDPFEMGVDPKSKKRNYDDASYVFRISKYTGEAFKAKFPGKDLPTRSRFPASSSEVSTIEDGDPADRYGNGDEISEEAMLSREFEIAQFQYYEVKKMHAIEDNGKIVYMDAGRMNKMRPMLDERGVRYSQEAKPTRIYKQIFLTPDEIIEEHDLACRAFTFRAITGMRDRNKGCWFGIIRLMRDPQKWANKWMVQVQHILNTQAKSGKVLFETGAFKNPQKSISEWSAIDAPGELNPGGLAKIQQLQPAAYPTGLDRLLQYALEAINDAPGTNAEMLGLADRQQAGVLEETRKKAGITIIAVFFDALRRYRKEQGRVLAEYIREYIADGRLIRIAGEIGEQAIPLMRDQMTLKYDVVVDDAPSSPNMKEKTFSVLSQILPMLMQSGVPIPPELLEYAPLPSSLINKWKKFISDNQQDPEAAEMKAIAKEGAKADVDNKKADAMKKMADAQKIYAEATKKPDNNGQYELELKRELGYAELNMKRELELLKIQSDSQIQQQRAQNDRETKLEVAQMASKPAATVQLGGNEVTEALSHAFAVIGEQNQQNQQQMAQMMDVMLQNQAQQAEAMNTTLVQAMGEVAQAMTAPKRIIKDKQGRPVGVEVGQ